MRTLEMPNKINKHIFIWKPYVDTSESGLKIKFGVQGDLQPTWSSVGCIYAAVYKGQRIDMLDRDLPELKSKI